LSEIGGEDLALVGHGGGQLEVLPPAPAQMSRTCSPGLAFAIRAAICEPSSCTSNQPFWNDGSV